MTLLSEIYDVTLKRDIRGAAKGGFVRPTVGEHFMSDRDFEEIPYIINNGENPAYSDLKSVSNLYILASAYINDRVAAQENPIYLVPKGYKYIWVDWTGGYTVGTTLLDNGHTVTANSWQRAITSWTITEPIYMEFKMLGGLYGCVGVCPNPTNTTNMWAYDYYSRFHYPGGSDLTPADAFKANGIIGMAVDPTRGYIWWHNDGVWQRGANGGDSPNFKY